MADTEQCSGCIWARDCKGVYEALGRAEGPCVAWKAMAAFLLPIFVSIVCVTVLDKALAGAVTNASARILLVVSGSAPACLATVFIVSRFARRWKPTVPECQLKEKHDQ